MEILGNTDKQEYITKHIHKNRHINIFILKQMISLPDLSKIFQRPETLPYKFHLMCKECVHTDTIMPQIKFLLATSYPFFIIILNNCSY